MHAGAQNLVGDRGALEKLVLRHQAWIYNIAIRMVFHPQDAGVAALSERVRQSFDPKRVLNRGRMTRGAAA